MRLLRAFVCSVCVVTLCACQAMDENAERIGRVDVDLREITLLDLEKALGQPSTSDRECRESTGPNSKTVYTPCKSYEWLGVAEGWDGESPVLVRVAFFYRFKGTFCGESFAVVNRARKACGLEIEAPHDGVIVRWNLRRR